MLQFIFRTLLILSFAIGQITDFNLTIDSRNIINNQNLYITTYLDKLKEDLEFYVLSNNFLQTNKELNISLDASITIESISDNRVISAYVLFSNGLDQLLFSDGVDFKYTLGDNLLYSTTYNSLTSFLDYNIFIMIAGELDKHNYKGGENYYIRAENIALKGTLSEYPRKWNRRLKKCKEIKDNTSLRKIKYIYVEINKYLDNSNEEFNDDLIIEYLENIYEELVTIDSQYGYNKETIIYLNSIKEGLVDLCLDYHMKYLIKFLTEYDKDNAEFYNESIN